MWPCFSPVGFFPLGLSLHKTFLSRQGGSSSRSPSVDRLLACTVDIRTYLALLRIGLVATLGRIPATDCTLPKLPCQPMLSLQKERFALWHWHSQNRVKGELLLPPPPSRNMLDAGKEMPRCLAFLGEESGSREICK